LKHNFEAQILLDVGRGTLTILLALLKGIPISGLSFLPPHLFSQQPHT
jgi:hypothetical protein